MSDLFNAFKSALSQAGPGLVAQIQGKDKISTELYRQGAKRASLERQQQEKIFSNEMKMKEMALNIQRSKDSIALRQAEENRRQAKFEQQQEAMSRGLVGAGGQPVKFQKLPDTFNVKTNNPVQIDPTKREGAIFDAITGEKVDKVYTGVQKRADKKDTLSANRSITKEMIRQGPVKNAMQSIDVMEELLEKGEAAVMKEEPIFGLRMGFTGSWRHGLTTLQRKSGWFETSEVDALHERFNSRGVLVLANQVKSFTGAQATDAEREFLAGMVPQPTFSPGRNKVLLKELRAMLQFIDKRNASILARLGSTLPKNFKIDSYIPPGQSLAVYYEKNIAGKFGNAMEEEKKAELTPDQTIKMNRYNQIQRRKIELKNRKQRLMRGTDD